MRSITGAFTLVVALSLGAFPVLAEESTPPADAEEASAPSEASSCAVQRPMPLPPPVTTAILSSVIRFSAAD